MDVNEDVFEEGATGAEHSFVSLKFETITGDQGDICEQSAPPKLLQIFNNLFIESKKHLTSNHFVRAAREGVWGV